jgi:hypothetical protein
MILRESSELLPHLSKRRKPETELDTRLVEYGVHFLLARSVREDIYDWRRSSINHSGP